MQLKADGRRAKIAIAVVTPLFALSPVSQAAQLRLSRDYLRDVREQSEAIRQSQFTGAPYRPIQPDLPANGVSYLTSLPTLVAAVLFLIWFHRAARFAAGRGRPARRSPGWAVGAWFIPIANFFLPYRSAVDLFRPDDRDSRRLVRIWWVSYMVLTLLNLPIAFVAAFNDDGTAAMIAIVALWFVAWMFVALQAVEFINRATSDLADASRVTPGSLGPAGGAGEYAEY